MRAEVAHAKSQINFPELCERRKRRVLERVDGLLARVMQELHQLHAATRESGSAEPAERSASTLTWAGVPRRGQA